MEFNVHIFAILSTIAIIFLLIGSVSATDIDANDTQIIYPNVDEILSVENDFDALNTDASTYSELINEIGSGGNIELKHDYYTYDTGSTIKITTDNSVINGKGATIDMAGSTIQTFSVSASGVTIKNLTIKNANYNGYGGTIYLNYCSCTVENCNFINNSAGSVGGAIYVAYLSEVSVENCNFANNKADGNGGAIYLDSGSSCTVENCNFTNNSAGSGGAGYFWGNAQVTNCNFTNNCAVSKDGGAIFLVNGSFCVVENCNFVNNTAGSEGGAIYLSYGYGSNVENCNFTYNTAISGSAIYMGDDSGNGVGTISNSLFLNNRANAEKGFPLTMVKNENNIKIIFRGQNNLLNAIYSRCSVNFTNVTYWGANGITNTGSSSTAPSRFNKEAGQNITVVVIVNEILVLNTTKVTDYDGQIILNSSIEDIYTITARHDADSYYTQAETTKTLINPTNTYSELASEIGFGGNIELQHDYYTYDYGDTIEIAIDNSVINGNGAIIDMADSTIQAFKVSASGVTIKNLTIKNANYTGLGGAIYFSNTGVSTVENCNFINNIAGTGGAIYFKYGSTGTVLNCNFTGNVADAEGGAIMFWEEGTVTNCDFTNNVADLEGGAIYFNNWGTVTNCDFTNNTASKRDGGAIYTSSGTVTNCSFTNNVADECGGAINFAYEGTVTNCSFTNDKAAKGGAVYFWSFGKVTNCDFIYNEANRGGAIYFYGHDYYSEYGNVENSANYVCPISNSLFLNNKANVEDSFPLTIVKTENNIKIIFKGQNNLLNAIYSNVDIDFTNVTYWGANGITNTDSSSTTPFRFNAEAGQNITVVVVVNGTLVLNTTKVTDDYGQIILDMSIDDNYIITARHDEDSYYTQVETTKMPTGSSTYTQLASEIGSGGNIELKYAYYSYDDSSPISITTNNSIIDGNGAVIDMDGSSIRAFNVIASGVTIKNLTIKNADGGAIYFSDSGAVKNCNFTNNKAYNGGAIYFNNSGTLEYCNFTNNKAYNGGAIYFSDSGTVENCNFTYNKAATDGGAIWFTNNCNVTNCNFTGNKAFEYSEFIGHILSYGGAIYTSSGTITNCSFTDNYGYYVGGAIYIKSGTVINCSFTRNHVSDYEGGAIYMDSGNITNCNFTGNVADYGCAIYTGSGTVSNCDFYYNDRPIRFSNLGAVINCNFAHNSGRIEFVEFGTVTGCNFTSNSYQLIQINNGVVENCSFTNNRGWGHEGGAINIRSGNVANCNFTNDSAYNGGAIYMDSGTVERCSFISCSASNYGGGIYFNSESCSMYDCYFKNNTAKNGSDWYSEYDIKNIITKVSTNLAASEVTTTYVVSKKLTVTLKDVNGNALASQNIKIKVGTISKTLITDSNGQASIDVSTLIPETYSADIIFAGDDKYNASSATTKVTVKKATPKLTSKAKSFKKSVKTKKYTITLKNHKNKVMKNTKVIIKVNKKTYTAKTNNKGVATFKITKLNKKGTFKSTVTYNGNKYYNKVTKKVNIKVK